MATRCLFLSLLFYFVAFVIQEGHAISMADWHCGSDSYPFSRLFAKKLTKHMCFRQEEVILQINDCCEVHDQCYCEPGETQESCDQVFCECLESMTSSSLVALVFTVSTVYGTPSLLLYVYVVAILVRNRHIFSTWFYRLFVVNGVLDCTDVVTQIFSDRLPYRGLFASLYHSLPPFVPTIFFFLKYFHLYAHFFGSLAIGLNRLLVAGISTSAGFFQEGPVERSLQILSKRIVNWASLLVISCGPLLFTHQILSTGARYIYFDESNSSLVLSYNTQAVPNFRNSEKAILVISVVAVLSLLLNGATLLAIIRCRTRILSPTDAKIRTAEIKLSIASMLIFCCELLMVAYQAVAYSFPQNDAVLSVLFAMYPFVYDSCMLSSPWILLATSTKVRRHVNSLFSARRQVASASS
ncbi:hypothetical protein QR680_005792 [Steinernema hermaphroditum]|uniref:Serpentine receptor class gamma n=1 Tax=Steinernema hermaphroditum TaxID=289476 RepID=A0AA39HVM1_9BILA|nr:hypothetical protein QR680_005792 [Steinernema hermaphroditum]